MKRSEFFKRAAQTVVGAAVSGVALASGVAEATAPAEAVMTPDPPMTDAEREAYQKQYAELWMRQRFDEARHEGAKRDLDRWREWDRSRGEDKAR